MTRCPKTLSFHQTTRRLVQESINQLFDSCCFCFYFKVYYITAINMSSRMPKPNSSYVCLKELTLSNRQFKQRMAVFFRIMSRSSLLQVNTGSVDRGLHSCNSLCETMLKQDTRKRSCRRWEERPGWTGRSLCLFSVLLSPSSLGAGHQW